MTPVWSKNGEQETMNFIMKYEWPNIFTRGWKGGIKGDLIFRRDIWWYKKNSRKEKSVLWDWCRLHWQRKIQSKYGQVPRCSGWIITDIIIGHAYSLGTARLLGANKNCPLLAETKAMKFHHSIAEQLFKTKQARTIFQIDVALLTTRVGDPDKYYWKKSRG